MSKPRIHSITHETGEVSTRSSKSRRYEYALVVEMPLLPEMERFQGYISGEIARGNKPSTSWVRTLKTLKAQEEAGYTVTQYAVSWHGTEALAEKALKAAYHRPGVRFFVAKVDTIIEPT